MIISGSQAAERRQQIDYQIQSTIHPVSHVIIEAHPDVLSHMRHTGWYEKPGVTVLEGRWQDFIESDILMSEGFDIIYTDTFSEQYGGLLIVLSHCNFLLSVITLQQTSLHSLNTFQIS